MDKQQTYCALTKIRQLEKKLSALRKALADEKNECSYWKNQYNRTLNQNIEPLDLAN